MSKPSQSPFMVDLLIVGGGPAGISAAVTFARLKRSAMVYDSGVYRNGASKSAHTIPGFDGIDPAQWRIKARQQVEQGYEWVKWRNAKVMGLKQTTLEVGQGSVDGFESVDENGDVVLARKVVLATGIKDHLPDIKGLESIWGNRAIHCVFCHGTETRHAPIAFLLPPSSVQMNPMKVESMMKLWSSLGHPAVYLLTHGSDPSTPDGLTNSGLTNHLEMVKKRNWNIIPDIIHEIEETPDGLSIHFEGDRTMLPVGYIVVLPDRLTPHDHSKSLLTPALLKHDLSPMGTIVPATPEELEGGTGLPPRMGDDARTSVRGLFWAGNVGSFMANVNVSVSQGQTAGFMAAEELGKEDMARL